MFEATRRGDVDVDAIESPTRRAQLRPILFQRRRLSGFRRRRFVDKKQCGVIGGSVGGGGS